MWATGAKYGRWTGGVNQRHEFWLLETDPLREVRGLYKVFEPSTWDRFQLFFRHYKDAGQVCLDIGKVHDARKQNQRQKRKYQQQVPIWVVWKSYLIECCQFGQNRCTQNSWALWCFIRWKSFGVFEPYGQWFWTKVCICKQATWASEWKVQRCYPRLCYVRDCRS